mgnify:CR=1 FL=1
MYKRQTIVNAAQALKDKGAKDVYVYITHAVLSGDAAEKIEKSKIKKLIRNQNLKTVCEEAACPNIGECWAQKHATVMILGDICTRSCAFCNVRTGKPRPVNPLEPDNVARMAFKIGLRHMVITSVDRDDLDDGGANHFSEVIKEIKKVNLCTTIEGLTPDFLRKGEAYIKVVAANPDVFNHNIETVPSLYRSVRPGSRYFASVNLLKSVKEINKTIFTKSGIMLGFGEKKDEVLQVMDDLRSANVDFLTLGQYLQPTKKHAAVDKYLSPEEFENYKIIAESKGFLMVSSSPLTRSSHHAEEDFHILRQNRLKSNS